MNNIENLFQYISNVYATVIRLKSPVLQTYTFLANGIIKSVRGSIRETNLNTTSHLLPLANYQNLPNTTLSTL